MKVSVLMPTYNRASLVPGSHGTTLVERALMSVLEQGYHDFEVLILNDGSTDTTSQILKRYAADYGKVNTDLPHVSIWDYETNMAPPNNMNFLWEQATGDLICQMHDDDVMPEGSIESRVKLFTEHPEMQVLYGGWYTQDISGKNMVKYLATPPNHEKIMHSEYVNFTTLMYRRDLPFRFDPALRYYFDWLFKIRCLHESNTGYIPAPVMIHTVHEGQETTKCRRENANALQELMMREKLKSLGYKC